MIEFIFIAYSLFSILYFILLVRDISESSCILTDSKSRDMKNLAKNKITRYKRDIILCLVWPYILYRDISLAIRALQSLK